MTDSVVGQPQLGDRLQEVAHRVPVVVDRAGGRVVARLQRGFERGFPGLECIVQRLYLFLHAGGGPAPLATGLRAPSATMARVDWGKSVAYQTPIIEP